MKPFHRYIRYIAHWRCSERVVVIESDDWGLSRRSCADLIAHYGKPSEWAYEQTESPDDLEALYTILTKFKDRYNRPACFTANFVVANPNVEAIATNGFANYYDIPLHNDRALMSLWLEGCDRQVFYPQYHGRSHFSTYAYLKDLRENIPGARNLFFQHCFGGLSLVKGLGWRYHSEYIDWKTGNSLSGNALAKWLHKGLKYFRDTFGRFPISTIAPHYIFTPNQLHEWSNCGFRFIQGGNYHIVRDKNGSPTVLPHILGERIGNNMRILCRTVKFEPRPSRIQSQGLHQALKQIEQCLKSGIPIVIDTHRINYTGIFRDFALSQLEQLLKALWELDVIFLTSTELGQAIENNGKFQSAWSNSVYQLTPRDSLFRQFIRTIYHRVFAPNRK